jgi:acetyltransferase-like isoleucine patch superfamily enzyme
MQSVFAVQPTPIDLIRNGLLQVGEGCQIHPMAVFCPSDLLGEQRPIVLGDGVQVGPFATIHGGARVAAGVFIGQGAVIGEPEYGYAVREVHAGQGAPTDIGPDVTVRGGAVIYAGVRIGATSTIGHHTLLRTNVQVGAGTQLAANMTIERGTCIGDQVRCSPGSHITADTVIEDRAFIGAGVRTINDKQLIWRDPEHEQPLCPPRFNHGCKVGTGAVVMGGVTVGARALVGAGSVVTRSVAPDAVVYGVPARQYGEVTR